MLYLYYNIAAYHLIMIYSNKIGKINLIILENNNNDVIVHALSTSEVTTLV